jgi:hypothetical protein
MGEDKNGLGGDAQRAADRTARRARRAAFETAPAGGGLGAAAGDFAEDVRDGAEGFMQDVRGAAESLLDEQKARVADMAHGFANALRGSADAFAEEGSAVVARYADQIAEQVDHLCDAVRHQHWRDLLANVEDAARRRPEWFLAGAIAAGFLVGRIMTGAAPRDSAET